MKIFNSFILSLVFITSVFAQIEDNSRVTTSLFSNYRLPTTTYHNLKFHGSGNLGLFAIAGGTKTRNLTVYFAPDFNYLSNSENHEDQINFISQGNYSSQISEQNETEREQSSYSQRILLEGHRNRYIFESNLYWQLAGSVNLSLSERNEDDPAIEFNHYESVKTQIYSAEIGFGWGKIRDVTPVVTALRIDKRLNKLGRKTDFSNSEIVKIAGTVSRLNYFSMNYDKPEKYFWNSVEGELADLGHKYELNYFEQNYLNDVLDEIKFLRQEGLKIGLNLALLYSKDWQKYVRNEYNNNPFTAESLIPQVKFYTNYYHQLDLFSQINLMADLSAGSEVIIDNTGKQNYDFNIHVGYLREFRDRFLWKISNTAKYHIINRNEQLSRFENRFETSLSYYIEDNISLSVSYSWKYYDVNYNHYMFDHTKNDHNIFFGITYFISKGLEI